MFSSLPDSLSLQVLREYESKIDEVCWLICKKNYVQRDNALLSDACVYQLFRVFCLLGDLVPDPKCRDCYQVPINLFLSSQSVCCIVIHCSFLVFLVDFNVTNELLVMLEDKKLNLR